MYCCDFWIIFLLFTLSPSLAVEDRFNFYQRNIFRSENRIVGGEFVDITKVPCQVSVQYLNRNTHLNTHLCGGSILNERFILTAAHCFDMIPLQLVSVYIGSNSTKENGTSFNVTHVNIHPNYKAYDYDFTILELSENITFNERQKPAVLPKNQEDIPDGALLRTSGWGETQNANESNKFLRGVEVVKINQNLCNQAYSGDITDRMVCAGFMEGGKDSCQGDSGGPLLMGNLLVGVVSWGEDCACPGYPGVYAKVSSVRQWIRNITGL
ncbi:trypsin [Sergentomyia squamirostris]